MKTLPPAHRDSNRLGLAVARQLKTHWTEIIPALLILITCGVLAHFAESRIPSLFKPNGGQEPTSQSDKVVKLDDKSQECLDVSALCLGRGEYERCISLMRKRVMELDNPDVGIKVIQEALSRKPFQIIRNEVEGLRIELYQEWEKRRANTTQIRAP